MLSLGDILITLAVFLGLVYLYFKKRFGYWEIRNVSCKTPIFPFGNVLDIVRGKTQVGQYFAQLYDEVEGPYFGFYAFAKPFLVIKDPELIKRILIKDFHAFSNRVGVADEKIDSIVGNALVTIKNPQWKALRSKLSPVFTSGKMKMMMYLMKECGENLKSYIETVLDKNIEAREITTKYTIDVITSCAFGINANSFVNKNSDFSIAAGKLFPNTPRRALRAFAFIFVPIIVKIFKINLLDPIGVKFLRTVFTETMDTREKTKARRNDLIDILIELKNQETKDDEFKFYGDRLLAQAILFFNAGQESTSSTIMFTLHELCINTDIQDKVRKEIQEVIGIHGDLTYEALNDMKYLHMVVCETLRKYPLTPFIVRECVEEYKIPETGLVIEKGIPIFIPQHGLNWDPKYFPNPEKYDPERFNEANKSKLHSYVYLPFGDGPRNCIGERFGLMASKLGIIYIIKHFKVERNFLTEDPLVFKPTPLLVARNGVPITLRKLTM